MKRPNAGDALSFSSTLMKKAQSRIEEHRARAEKAAYGVYEVAGKKTLMVMRSVGDTARKPVHTEDSFSAALQWVIANSPAYHPRDGAAESRRSGSARGGGSKKTDKK